ncbi:MAG: hypothetical protein A2428_00985 [Bdellovibrionales bacterium RIFOXYC1_FULL_54_43]|nr:MAG: hypothetical protein A2428_00985 [Bdellovibrionales bacterium RIFOXYC1_FULL_54_43]
MMKNDDIRNAIDTAIEARSERTQITQDRVLKELAVIAFARISDFADWTDQELTIKRSDEISPELTSAIKSLIIQADRQSSRKSIALHDKLQCLELLGRHLGMFNGGSSNSQESRPELLQRLSDYFKKKSGAPDAANSK